MNSRTYLVILLVFACIAMFVAGCTTTTTIGNPAPAPAASPVAAAAAPSSAAALPAAPGAPVAAATTPSCPDKLVWDGNWDTREVGYASNHDVRDAGVWTEAGPVPVTFTQKCWDVTGTFKVGDCEDGKLTGKIEKNTLSGTYTENCAAAAGSTQGTFALTMAADNQSFMGSKYNYYGPDANFPPSWLGKKMG
jgi:hypothetical protein